MRKKLSSLISKYGSFIQFEEKASQTEKEKYFLLSRAITLEYNQYKFSHRNKIDYVISQYLKNQEDTEIIPIAEDDKYFSIFSEFQFFSISNALNLESDIFNEFPNQIEFNSILQYLVFNKSVLFIDRNSAKRSLRSPDKKELLEIYYNIENFNGIVWAEYKTQFLEKGLLSLIDNNSDFEDKISNFSKIYFVFKSDFENWGVVNVDEFLENELKKTYNYKNYLGKILTSITIESQLKKSKTRTHNM